VRDRVFCHFPHGSPAQAAEIPGFLLDTYFRRGEWKLIRFHAANADGTDRLELYHLGEDPGETDNRAAVRPELARAGRADRRVPARDRGGGAGPQPPPPSRRGARPRPQKEAAATLSAVAGGLDFRSGPGS